MKRVYVKAIDDYSAKSLTPIFEEHISTSAKIFTDKWRGYSPLKAKYNIEQKKVKTERILKKNAYCNSSNKILDKNSSNSC